MKKLSLKPNAFNRGEVLTRSQLKKVMGGNGSEDGGTGSGDDCKDECKTDADCTGTYKKCTSSTDIGGPCDGKTRKYCTN